VTSSARCVFPGVRFPARVARLRARDSEDLELGRSTEVQLSVTRDGRALPGSEVRARARARAGARARGEAAGGRGGRERWR
jgi:hypothetical protein